MWSVLIFVIIYLKVKFFYILFFVASYRHYSILLKN